MSTALNKAPVISLSEGFGALVVQGHNIKVEVFDDGSVVAYTDGDVQKRPPITAEQLTGPTTTSPVVGVGMADGTVYAGVSPDTGKPMYTTRKDTGLCGEWNKAMDYAARLDAHGYTDWRVPTKAELNVLYKNRAAIGNFNETDSAGWYWSSSQYLNYRACGQRFSFGHQHNNYKTHASSLRCVRG